MAVADAAGPDLWSTSWKIVPTPSWRIVVTDCMLRLADPCVEECFAMHLGCTAAACSCAERPHAGCPADRRQASSRSACQNVVQAESWYYWETVKKDEAQGARKQLQREHD